MAGSLLVREVRPVRLDADGDVGPVDVRIADGVVVEVGARLRSLGEPELEASGVIETRGRHGSFITPTSSRSRAIAIG